MMLSTTTQKAIHLKTGEAYQVLSTLVYNCTNSNVDQHMILYRSTKNHELLFVRESKEFMEKFKILP